MIFRVWRNLGRIFTDGLPTFYVIWQNIQDKPFMYNVVKWPNGVHTAKFLKYIWPFYNIMQVRVKNDNVNKLNSLQHDLWLDTEI